MIWPLTSIKPGPVRPPSGRIVSTMGLGSFAIVIRIKPGIYREQIRVSAGMKHLTLRGDDPLRGESRHRPGGAYPRRTAMRRGWPRSRAPLVRTASSRGTSLALNTSTATITASTNMVIESMSICQSSLGSQLCMQPNITTVLGVLKDAAAICFTLATWHVATTR